MTSLGRVKKTFAQVVKKRPEQKKKFKPVKQSAELVFSQVASVTRNPTSVRYLNMIQVISLMLNFTEYFTPNLIREMKFRETP